MALRARRHEPALSPPRLAPIPSARSPASGPVALIPGSGYKERMPRATPLKPARIVDFPVIQRLRKKLGRIVVASGGIDPLHPGHASNLLEAKKLGDTLLVIVNGDAFLRNKKGKAFQDLKTRCQIVSFVRGVDYVIPFEIENDQTVCEALKWLKPHVFAKGGDRAAPH